MDFDWDVDDEGYGQGEVYGPNVPVHTDWVEEGFEFEDDGEVHGGGLVSVEEYFEGI